MSDSSPRNRKARRLFSLFLLAVFLPLLSGCVFGEKRRTFSPPDEELLRSKADPRLRKEAETGGTEPFAAIAVYRNDVFLDQSEALGRSSLTVLNEMGRTALLLLSSGQIVPLLKEPSLRKATWFGPQRLLSKLDPSMELDMLTRFGAGTEDRDVDLLVRFTEIGGTEEDRRVAAAGYRVVTRAGPTWVVTGPMSGVPKLLESDRIVYLKGASEARIVPLRTDPPPPSPTTILKTSASRQLIIKFRPGTIACTPAGIARFSSTTGVSLEFVRTMSGDACVVKQVADTADAFLDGQKTLIENPEVEYLEQDTIMKAS